MRKVIFCLALTAAGLFGQSVDSVARLNTVLSKALVSSDATGELTATLMSLTKPERHISANEVGRLANALSGSMTGREIREPQTVSVSRCVAGLLEGSETSNFALAAQLRDALTALRVGDQRIDLIVRRFVAVGGPNDYPTKPNPLMLPYRK